MLMDLANYIGIVLRVVDETKVSGTPKVGCIGLIVASQEPIYNAKVKK
jgi:hypothetical protein